jgi:hypothetical protein
MHTVRALEKLLAILTPIAMRMLRLRDLARLAPDLPVNQVVSVDVVQVVTLLDQSERFAISAVPLPALVASLTAGAMVFRVGGRCGPDESVSTPSCSAFLLPLSFLLHDCVSTCQYQ